MVTGSNVAPLFTLVPLVPNIVAHLGLDPITTMLGMQNGASLGLFLSPNQSRNGRRSRRGTY